MGNACGKLCGSGKKIKKEKEREPEPGWSPESLPDLPQTIEEEEIIVKDNKDSYFTRDDIVAIIQKYPEYREWEKQQGEKPKPKQRKIRWREAEVIGNGSFGRVVLGLNRDNGEIMAVKQVHIGGLSSQIIQDKINALEAELDLLSEFTHKNIVRYIGTTRNTESFNIFLEYVAGGTIAGLVGKYGPFNETIIKIYIKQILEGLEYLHARNIIHRDIKGANVLVDNTGVCKLADFGSAKKIKDLLEGDALHSLKGTANWMAPEVITQRGLGRFADIWSIGCVLIEMATGKPPWSGGNQMATMIQIAKTKTPPPYPPNISNDCRDFLDHCFKINPKERGNVIFLLNHKFLKDVDNLSSEEKNQLLGHSHMLQQHQPRLGLDLLKGIGGTGTSVRGSLRELSGSNGMTPEEYKKSPNLERERLSRQARLSQNKKLLEQKGELNALNRLVQHPNKDATEQKNPTLDQNNSKTTEPVSQKPDAGGKDVEKEKNEGKSKAIEETSFEKQMKKNKNDAAAVDKNSPQQNQEQEHEQAEQIDLLKPIHKDETGPTAETKDILSQNGSNHFHRSDIKHVSNTDTIGIENVEEPDSPEVRNKTNLIHQRNDGSAGGEQILLKNSGYYFSGTRMATDGDSSPSKKGPNKLRFQRGDYGKGRAQTYFQDPDSNLGSLPNLQLKHGHSAQGFLQPNIPVKSEKNYSAFVKEHNNEFFDGVQQHQFDDEFPGI